jgi:hypothetical protein
LRFLWKTGNRNGKYRNLEDSGRNMQPRGAWWGGVRCGGFAVIDHYLALWWRDLQGQSQQVGCLFLDSGCANTLQQRTAQVVGLLIGSYVTLGDGTILSVMVLWCILLLHCQTIWVSLTLGILIPCLWLCWHDTSSTLSLHCSSQWIAYEVDQFWQWWVWCNFCVLLMQRRKWDRVWRCRLQLHCLSVCDWPVYWPVQSVRTTLLTSLFVCY